MSKFDRCIFISIAIGIWAFAMTQVFKPSKVVALGKGCGSSSDPCFIAAPYGVEVRHYSVGGHKLKSPFVVEVQNKWGESGKREPLLVKVVK